MASALGSTMAATARFRYNTILSVRVLELLADAPCRHTELADEGWGCLQQMLHVNAEHSVSTSGKPLLKNQASV